MVEDGIKKYILKRVNEDKQITISEALKRLGLGPLYFDKFDIIDPKEKIIFKCMYNVQKASHKSTLEQIKKICNFSEESSIPIVFMKGYFTALDLYTDPNRRITGDIDILVKENDFWKVSEFLKSIGFECELTNDEQVKQQLQLHHVVFHKTIDGHEVEVEVHTYVCTPYLEYKELTTLAWQNVCQENIGGCKVWRMSPEIRFIHYMLHFYKHAISYFEFAVLGITHLFKMQILLDVCLLAEKYDLSYDFINSVVKKMFIQKEIQFGINIINEVLPNFLSAPFIEQLNIEKKR